MNKKRRAVQVAFLIGITIGVIALGYFSAGQIINLLSSYEGEVVSMEDKEISQRLYGENDQITLPPWIYYDHEKQQPLGGYQKEILWKAGFNKTVNWMFCPGARAQIGFNAGTTAEQGMKEKDGEYFHPFDSTVFLKGMEAQKESTGEWYQVDCAVAAGSFVYYHQRPVNRQRTHREKMEQAYRAFSQYIEDEKTGEIYHRREEGMTGELFIGYLKQINTATAMFGCQQDSWAYSRFTEGMTFGRIETGYQIVDFDYDQVMQFSFKDVTDIYMTDQELIMELGVSISRYHYDIKSQMVLFFDPMEWNFCGFSFQGDWVKIEESLR